MAGETKYFKCPCAHCGGHIEFPAEAAGLTLACPHCGRNTDLTVPLAFSPSPAGMDTYRVGRKIMWLAVAGVVLIVGLLAGLAALNRFKERLPPRQMEKPVPIIKKTTTPISISTNEFTVTGISIVNTKGSGLIYATGAVQNEANRARYSVRVEIDLLDETGNRIGTATDTVGTLEAKKEWRFKALVTLVKPAGARLASIREE